jgi:hypothetical protein
VTHYRNGKVREYKVRDEMVNHGWATVSQSGGSKGAVDLVMVHLEHGHAYVQVGSRTKTLGPADRERLCDLADIDGALPILAIVVPRQPVTYWHVDRGTPGGWTRYDLTDPAPAATSTLAAGAATPKETT